MKHPRRACQLCDQLATGSLAQRTEHTSHLLRNGAHPSRLDRPGWRAA